MRPAFGPMSFVGFLQYCFAVKVSPVHVLAAVLHDISELRRDDCIYIDLCALAGDERPEIRPLRKWATRRLRTLPATQDGVLAQTLGQVADMADVIGMEYKTLMETLAQFAPLAETDV